MFGWRKNERGEGGGERWEGLEGLRASLAALYLAFYLGMWRAKMKKWCSNSSLFHSSYCQIATVIFHKWKVTVTHHWIKKLYPVLPHFLIFLFSFSFFLLSSFPRSALSLSLFPFFLLFSPILSSPVSSIEAPFSTWCGVPISTWGGARSQPGWSADLGLDGTPISAWGGARSGFRDLVGFWIIFCWFYW